MSKYDLQLLLEKKKGVTDHKLNMLSKKSESGQNFFQQINVTDSMEKLIKLTLAKIDHQEYQEQNRQMIKNVRASRLSLNSVETKKTKVSHKDHLNGRIIGLI